MSKAEKKEYEEALDKLELEEKMKAAEKTGKEEPEDQAEAEEKLEKEDKAEAEEKLTQEEQAEAEEKLTKEDQAETEEKSGEKETPKTSEKTEKAGKTDKAEKKKKKKRKKKKKGLWRLMKDHKAASFVICLVLVCLLTVGGTIGSIMWGLYSDSVGIVEPGDVDPTAEDVQIAREDQKNEDVINVLLVGSDSRDPNAEMGRSDTMMLVSFNKADNKASVISFLRDTLIEIDGYGQSKLGHTFAYGGVGLTINTLNKQFDLDIQDYIVINFENLVGIIDQLGGIQVNLTEEEAEYYRSNGMPDIQAGYVTLTGSQALTHARNRSLDNDFGRTRRQRAVLYGIYNKVMELKDPSVILSLINYCMTQVSTNMSVTELYDIAMDVLGTEHLMTQQAAVPKEGTYSFGTYDDMSVVEIDLEANKQYIKELLY